MQKTILLLVIATTFAHHAEQKTKSYSSPLRKGLQFNLFLLASLSKSSKQFGYGHKMPNLTVKRDGREAARPLPQRLAYY